MEILYDSLNEHYHYLIFHLDGLHDDLYSKHYNFLLDNYINENPKNLKLIMLKDGKNIFYNKDIDEELQIFDKYIESSDDFIIIKNPSYIKECFEICYSLINSVKHINKSADVIGNFDELKIHNKKVFRLFTGRTHYLRYFGYDEYDDDIDVVRKTFTSGEYLTIRTGFTSKIDTKKLVAHFERYKFLPNFLFLKDKKVFIKNEDIFTEDSPRRLDTTEFIKDLDDFIKADINDGMIVFANTNYIEEYLQLLMVLKTFEYCSVKDFSDISRIVVLKIGDYNKMLYLRLDCEEIFS